MVVIAGNDIKMGGLVEVIKHRLNEEISYIEENMNIRKQENDILAIKDVSYIIYDIDQYLNEADELIEVIRRIKRTNKATPILLVPSINPKNELIKIAVTGGIKSFINAAASMGEQKDELEKIISGYFEANVRDEVKEAQEEISEDNKTLNAFVGELYDAKQREEEKENTIIINQKKNSEIAAMIVSNVLKVIFSIISVILMAIAIITLVYPTSRTAFIEVMKGILAQLHIML